MKVLFFSPDTFGYCKKITAELKLQGHEVDWHNHIQVTSNFDRVKARLFPKLTAKLSESFFVNQIDWEKHYDVVLVIKGEGLSSELLNKMRKNFTEARFVYYTWDSLTNVRKLKDNFQYYDSLVSFDRDDCRKFKGLKYLPLFFSPEFGVPEKGLDRDYSSVFIGTLHSNRFRDVTALTVEIEKITNKTSYRYFFFPSKPLFYLRKVLDRNFRAIPIELVSFNKLSSNEVVNKITKSDIVIDYSHPGQSGLTMRTIEALGMNKKLITNNSAIKQEPFYDSENIFVLERGTYSGLSTFLKTPFKPVDKKVYENYTLSAWVRRLIEC